MQHAFESGFEQGFRNIIIIGSDLYDLETADLENAFSLLKNKEVVIGPERPFIIIGERINPTGRKMLAKEMAAGDYVITMDADLQDDPEEIPNLIAGLDSGEFDLISGWKKKRHDPISKTMPSKFFNFVTSRITGIPPMLPSRKMSSEK